MGKQIKKMRVCFSLLFTFIMAASFPGLSKEQSNMFLKSSERSKCGDQCAKEKDKCHRRAEYDGKGEREVERADCCCNNEMKRCKCVNCKYEDGCEESANESCPKLKEHGIC